MNKSAENQSICETKNKSENFRISWKKKSFVDELTLIENFQFPSWDMLRLFLYTN